MINQYQAETLTKILQTLNELPSWDKCSFDMETSDRMVTFTFENDLIDDTLKSYLFKEWLFDTRTERNGTLTAMFEL